MIFDSFPGVLFLSVHLGGLFLMGHPTTTQQLPSSTTLPPQAQGLDSAPTPVPAPALVPNTTKRHGVGSLSLFLRKVQKFFRKTHVPSVLFNHFSVTFTISVMCSLHNQTCSTIYSVYLSGLPPHQQALAERLSQAEYLR